MTCQENSHAFFQQTYEPVAPNICLTAGAALTSNEILSPSFWSPLWSYIFFLFLKKNCHIMYFDYVLSHPVLSRSFPTPCPSIFGFILFTSFNTKMQNKNPIFQNSTTLNVSYHTWPCMLLKITPLILWLCLIYKVLHLNTSILLTETTLFTITGSS